VPEGNVSFGTSRRRFDIRLRRDPVGEIASLFDDSALVVLDFFMYETDRKPRWSGGFRRLLGNQAAVSSSAHAVASVSDEVEDMFD